MGKIRIIKEKLQAEFLNPDSLKQIVRYLIVGISTVIIEYSLFLFFRKILPLHAVVTNIIVYTFVFWFNFLLSKFFTFKSHKNFRKQLVSYALLFFFNMVFAAVLLFSAITWLFEYLFPNISWISYYLPKIIQQASVVVWNFILYKKVIYKD